MEIESKPVWHNNQEQQLIQSLDSSALVSITDPKGIIIYVNATFCEISGYDEQELLGRNHRILNSKKQPAGLFKGMWAAISSNRIWKGEICNKRKDGSFYWVRATIVPFVDKHGDIEKFVAIRYDITKNKEDTNRLKIAENKFSNIFNTANDAIFIINKNTKKITNINKKATELLGYTNAEFNGMHFVNLSSKKNMALIYKQLKHLARVNDIIFEAELEHKNGSVINVEISSKVFNDGQEDVIQCIVRDIRLRKQKEEQLRSSEEKFKFLFDSAPDAYFICDTKGEIKKWNTAAMNITGYSTKDISNRNIFDFDILSNNMKAKTKELLNAVDGEAYGSSEIKIKSKEGKLIDIALTSHPVEIDGENLILNIGRDITKNKATHEKLQEKTDELELFLYRSGHDLRAPYTTLEGLVQLIKQEQISEGAMELLEMFEHTLNNGKILIDNLSTASKISNQTITSENIDFNNLLKQTLIVLKQTDGYDDICFNINITKQLNFPSNPYILSSILQNILQNAIKFRRPRSSSHTPFIVINAIKTDSGVKITIKDNGTGINKEDLDNVFNLYYRSNHIVDGTGMGLYITKNSVEKLKGTIAVSSIINKETQFDIQLPNLHIA